ncbi:MAG TPA: DUF58 domain-containing protein [Bryobacteraceae bacterium]|nr:DUF58 domain-containing protein [Bryobacteraceae bacterium]
MAQAPLLDQAFLHKLERLMLHWQRPFRGLVGGRIPSRFAGPGQEFLDHRHFHHGDDLRAVNWRAYMRLEKLFLKMFQVEPRIPVRLLIDVSESMANKFEYARRLAAALCYIGLVRLDTICVVPFSDKLFEAHMCSGGRHRFLPAARFLEELKAVGRTDLMRVSRDFLADYPQRGLVLILSDFLGEADAEKPLQYIADAGHELTLIQVWAQEDREPQWEGELDLEDVETGTRFELAADRSVLEKYRAEFDAHSRRLHDLALRAGGRYVGLSSNTQLEEAIFDSMLRTGAVQ